jgi:hypothetical protein
MSSNQNLFYYSCDAAVPQIPQIQDVLFALRLSDEQQAYNFCRSNHEVYVVNVHLAASVVVSRGILSAKQDMIRKMIAVTVMDLCPEEAKCFFNSAYVEVRREVGGSIPPQDIGRQKLQKLCGCKHCMKTQDS